MRKRLAKKIFKNTYLEMYLKKGMSPATVCKNARVMKAQKVLSYEERLQQSCRPITKKEKKYYERLSDQSCMFETGIDI